MSLITFSYDDPCPTAFYVYVFASSFVSSSRRFPYDHPLPAKYAKQCKVRSPNAPLRGVIACLREAASAKAGRSRPTKLFFVRTGPNPQ
jgi:hypothetical protein